MNKGYRDRKGITEAIGLSGNRLLLLPGLLLVLVIMFLLYLASGGEGRTNMRISTDARGQEGNGESQAAAITDDGRRVAFASEASNLVAGDNNVVEDVFLKDTWSGVAVRYSTDSGGGQGNGNSFDPTVSLNGSRIAFSSVATNLVPGDNNGVNDIFVKDTQTGATSRISTDAAGAQASGSSFFPAIFDDGRYISFRSVATNLVAGDVDALSDIYRKDTQTGAIILMSSDTAGTKADRDSWDPSISPDGRYAVFATDATNLSSSDTNNTYDVYLKDSQTGTTVLVSANSAGVAGNGWSFGPVVSSSGSHAAFQSQATDLVPGDSNAVYDVFSVASFPGNSYLWTWYDEVGGDNWVLVANPADASGDLWYDLYIGGNHMQVYGLPGYSPGRVPPGSIVAPRYLGVIGGPVQVGQLNSAAALVSRRTLWPSGGNSLEEVVGVPASSLANHYYWT